MNKKVTAFVVGTIMVIAIALGVVASAESLLPEGVQEFRNDCGYICYVWPDGSGDCYPCLQCDECEECYERVDPTPTPRHEPTPTDEPNDKQPCNRGIGNGSEDCDPGNSGGQGQGGGRRAGEDRDE